MGGVADAATTMGVARAPWDRNVDVSLKPAAALVLGAWVLMAWSRFGAQGLTAPRVAVRFVLVGLYGWLALAVLVWAAGRLADQLLARPGGGPEGAGPELARIVQFTGLAHRPLIILGFVIQFAAVLLRLQGPGLVLAIAALGLWMPAMLVAAVTSAFAVGPLRAALVVAGPYLAWLATAGRFLNQQVGHLL